MFTVQEQLYLATLHIDCWAIECRLVHLNNAAADAQSNSSLSEHDDYAVFETEEIMVYADELMCPNEKIYASYRVLKQANDAFRVVRFHLHETIRQEGRSEYEHVDSQTIEVARELTLYQAVLLAYRQSLLLIPFDAHADMQEWSIELDHLAEMENYQATSVAEMSM